MASGPAGPAAPTADRRGRVGFGITAGVLTAIMLGGTLPVPLYVLWEPKMGFGPLGVTVVFAAYVVGTLSALLGFGQLSDHIGRKKVMAGAIVLAAVSTAIFLAATSIGVLIVARIVSGMAVGFIGGTATAALAELSGRGGPQRAAVVASGANLGGLALGPLVAGLFAQYLPVPTRTVFWAYLALCAVLLVALPAIPETVRQPGPIDASAWVAGLVAAVILIAALVVIRTFGTTAQATPSPARCDDSWCNPCLVGRPPASHSRAK